MTPPGRGWLGDWVPTGRPSPRPSHRPGTDALRVVVAPSLAPRPARTSPQPMRPGTLQGLWGGGAARKICSGHLPPCLALLAAAQNFLQKERAPGDETAWPHPSGSGRNGACTGLSHSRKSRPCRVPPPSPLPPEWGGGGRSAGARGGAGGRRPAAGGGRFLPPPLSLPPSLRLLLPFLPFWG